jgi:hypothetical protein
VNAELRLLMTGAVCFMGMNLKMDAVAGRFSNDGAIVVSVTQCKKWILFGLRDSYLYLQDVS